MTLGSVVSREAIVQGLPGHGCEPWTRAPLPIPVQFRLENDPQRMGMQRIYSNSKYQSSYKTNLPDSTSAVMPQPISGLPEIGNQNAQVG